MRAPTDLWHRTNLTGPNPLPSRFTAGACGFLNLSQSGDRPDRYRDPSRFDTMPSTPNLQVWAKTSAPSGCSRCSFRRAPAQIPEGLDIHIVMDHYATHKTAKIKAWLA